MHIISLKRRARLVSPSFPKCRNVSSTLELYMLHYAQTHISSYTPARSTLSLRRRRERNLDLLRLHRAPAVPSPLLP